MFSQKIFLCLWPALFADGHRINVWQVVREVKSSENISKMLEQAVRDMAKNTIKRKFELKIFDKASSENKSLKKKNTFPYHFTRLWNFSLFTAVF